MTYQDQMVQKGINYLRAINQENRAGNLYGARELARDLGISELHIKQAIQAARDNQKRVELPMKLTMRPPIVKPFFDMITRKQQQIKEVEVDFLKELRINYSEDKETEFTFMMPIRIRVKRH